MHQFTRTNRCCCVGKVLPSTWYWWKKNTFWKPVSVYNTYPSEATDQRSSEFCVVGRFAITWSQQASCPLLVPRCGLFGFSLSWYWRNYSFPLSQLANLFEGQPTTHGTQKLPQTNQCVCVLKAVNQNMWSFRRYITCNRRQLSIKKKVGTSNTLKYCHCWYLIANLHLE